MSLIDTDGRFPLFLTRAQKWAITSESAPSSWKKWLATGTRSTRRTSASTSANVLSTPPAAAVYGPSRSVDSAIARGDVFIARSRGRNRTGAGSVRWRPPGRTPLSDRKIEDAHGCAWLLEPGRPYRIEHGVEIGRATIRAQE